MLGSAYFGAGALLCVGLAKALKLVLRESRPVGTTYKVTYGMPSTHSATISYYATFITLSCAYLPIHPLFFHTWFDGPINSTIVRWFVWPTAPLVATVVASTVCASRINLGHHTIKQVMGGVCVGVSFGALWFSWWKMGGAQTIAWWAVSFLPDFIQGLIR
ncbi:hypothetical protein FRC14_002742 [Serendipita sp. 396]|nr:hypothetical protein FRC14_002742 [Serendipita sp. 396]